MSAWAGRVRPTDRINLVLSGVVPIEGEHKSVQSVCTKHIYDGAAQILAMKTREERVAALLKIPPMIRPHIEAEALRLWKERKK